MGRITVVNHVSLDGVMQAPGRPDEDLRGGFAHVASRTLTEGSWSNTTILTGDAAGAVGTLKQSENVTIFGSGELIRSLIGHGLIDAWMLLIHPRVLGSGQRLFAADGAPAMLRLTDSVTTTTGVVIATYADGDA
jgi:dihydrofolate reductase